MSCIRIAAFLDASDTLGADQYRGRAVKIARSATPCTPADRCEEVLVIDMYEHSYDMDFGAAAGQYVDAFFNNINWEQVLPRTEALRLSAA